MNDMNKKIKYLVMDVDGTLTDGKIHMGNSGEIFKVFSIKDGYGIRDIAMPAGIVPVIITGRTSEIVTNRCKELGIENVFQGVKNKLEILQIITTDFSIVAYIGDDLNDLSCMIPVKEAGGIVGCPQDAVKGVLKISNFISSYDGGCGAVRDFIEWIVEKQEEN